MRGSAWHDVKSPIRSGCSTDLDTASFTCACGHPLTSDWRRAEHAGRVTTGETDIGDPTSGNRLSGRLSPNEILPVNPDRGCCVAEVPDSERFVPETGVVTLTEESVTLRSAADRFGRRQTCFGEETALFS